MSCYLSVSSRISLSLSDNIGTCFCGKFIFLFAETVAEGLFRSELSILSPANRDSGLFDTNYYHR